MTSLVAVILILSLFTVLKYTRFPSAAQGAGRPQARVCHVGALADASPRRRILVSGAPRAAAYRLISTLFLQ